MNVDEIIIKNKLLEEELQKILWQIENVVIPSVPVGGEDDFVVIREEGLKPQFSFKAQDHVALGETLDLIDIERGAKISGSRFYFLKGKLLVLRHLETFRVCKSEEILDT